MFKVLAVNSGIIGVIEIFSKKIAKIALLEIGVRLIPDHVLVHNSGR